MCRRKDSECISRRMLRVEVAGRRSRGRPKRRFMNEGKEDIKSVGVIDDNAEVRVKWR